MLQELVFDPYQHIHTCPNLGQVCPKYVPSRYHRFPPPNSRTLQAAVDGTPGAVDRTGGSLPSQPVKLRNLTKLLILSLISGMSWRERSVGTATNFQALTRNLLQAYWIRYGTCEAHVPPAAEAINKSITRTSWERKGKVQTSVLNAI